MLRDLVNEHTQAIRIDSHEQHQSLLNFGLVHACGSTQIAALPGRAPHFDLYAIDEEITRALGRRVELKSGGYLVIDQTEAMTTVDVNTGGFVRSAQF